MEHVITFLYLLKGLSQRDRKLSFAQAERKEQEVMG